MSKPDQVLAELRLLLGGSPAYLAGSCVAAQVYDKPDGWSDVDIFTPTQQVLVSTVQNLLNAGYSMDDRFSRVWHRWLRYGLKGWHTNSMRLHSRNDVETNVVYKLVDGHPTTSLAQVLESFDFGLLGVGYDLETDTPRDLRSYLFPTYDLDGPLPLMPNKRDNWLHGFVSQYNGLREAGRYAKYYTYGYDMTQVQEDLSIGYRMAASYHHGSFNQDKHLLGDIYDRLADRIDNDEIDELTEAYRELNFNDPLDEIMAALE